MGVFSSIYAEQANKKRLEWLSLLNEAIDQKSWDKVEALLEKMEREEFSE